MSQLTPTPTLENILDLGCKINRNVLITGYSGCGKTSRVLNWCSLNKFKTKYFTASTLDPYLHLTGVPDVQEIVRNEKKVKTLKMVRPTFWDAIEVLVIDEINRANREVRNALLELMLHGTINGTSVPNLKFVIAMRNPDDSELASFDVERMDKALLERLPLQVELDQELCFEYVHETFSDHFDSICMKLFVDDYNRLPLQLRVDVSPRMIEDMMITYVATNFNDEYLKFITAEAKLLALFPKLRKPLIDANFRLTDSQQRILDSLIMTTTPVSVKNVLLSSVSSNNLENGLPQPLKSTADPLKASSGDLYQVICFIEAQDALKARFTDLGVNLTEMFNEIWG